MKLIRKKPKIYKSRKKVLKKAKKEIFFIYDILPPEQIKKVAREVAGIKKYRSNKEKILAFSWRAALTVFLIVCFLTGFAPIKLIQHSIRALTQEQKIENFNLYSLNCSGDWQNSTKVSGMPDVTADGGLEMFSEENSAVYEGGTLNLICQNFDAREEEVEKLIKKETIIDSSSVNEEVISETSTQEIATSTKEFLLVPTTTEEIQESATEETAESATDTGLNMDADADADVETDTDTEKEIETYAETETETETETEATLEPGELEEENNIEEQENLILEENTNTQNEIVDEESAEEPISFFGKAKSFFKNLKIFAQEEDQFKEVKINFSLAAKKNELKKNESVEPKSEAIIDESIGEQEIIEIIPENEESEEKNQNTSSEKIIGLWNKFRNFFGNQTIKAHEEISPGESIIDETVDRVKTIIDENLTVYENQPEEIIEQEGKNLINVWYSLDGEAWWKLGSISESPASNASNGGYFEYSLLFVKSWDDVKKIKIKFEGLGEEENENKVYLDSAWLKVVYQEKGEEEEEEKDEEAEEEEEKEEVINLALSPNFEYGQIRQDVEEDGIRVIIIENGGMSELWYYASSSDPDSNGWTFFFGNSSLDDFSPLGIKDKTFFWLDSCRQGIYGFSIPEQSLFGNPISPDGKFYLEFQGKNQEKWQATLSEENEFKFIQGPLQ